MKRRMRSEEGWELSPAESLVDCPKSVAEKEGGVRGLRDCVTPFHILSWQLSDSRANMLNPAYEGRGRWRESPAF